jgi:hypothetical protein
MRKSLFSSRKPGRKMTAPSRPGRWVTSLSSSILGPRRSRTNELDLAGQPSRSGLTPQALADEYCSLMNPTSSRTSRRKYTVCLQDIVNNVNKLPQIKGLSGWKPLLYLAVTINQITVSVHSPERGLTLECFRGPRNYAWKNDVVGIQPGNNLAPRQLKSFINGVRLTSVPLAYKGYAVCVLAYNAGGFIG